MDKDECGTDLIKERPNSVEFTINGKGIWSSKVKVYDDDITVAYANALGVANMTENILKTKNGEPNGK